MVLSFIAALGMGPLAVAAWNHMPAHWLCDYGETVNQAHREKKLAFFPWAFLFSIGFGGAYARMGLEWSLAQGGCGALWVWERACVCEGSGGEKELLLWRLCTAVILAVLWIMLLLCIADLKFLIIPDQLSAALLFLGILMIALRTRAGGEGADHAAGFWRGFFSMLAVGIGSGFLCAGGFWIFSRFAAKAWAGASRAVAGGFWTFSRFAAKAWTGASRAVAGGASQICAKAKKAGEKKEWEKKAGEKKAGEKKAGEKKAGEKKAGEAADAVDAVDAVWKARLASPASEAAGAIETAAEAAGFGDVKLLFALGVLLGAEAGLFILWLAYLAGGLHFSVLVVFRRAGLKEERAFSPYICLSAAYWLLTICPLGHGRGCG